MSKKWKFPYTLDCSPDSIRVLYRIEVRSFKNKNLKNKSVLIRIESLFKYCPIFKKLRLCRAKRCVYVVKCKNFMITSLGPKFKKNNCVLTRLMSCLNKNPPPPAKFFSNRIQDCNLEYTVLVIYFVNLVS